MLYVNDKPICFREKVSTSELRIEMKEITLQK